MYIASRRPRMGSGGGVVPTSWRALAAAALALWLLPVLLALALLWLPLLCCAVAAVRFRRVRKQLRTTSRGCGGRGGVVPWREEIIAADDDAGDRTRLLHRYLRDQMELVVAGADAEELVDELLVDQ
ncbi:uncharacterized protein [Setaria viridis]|uniref:Uncharacterized protein n=1 Tax=Setaria viridis TaxID=4556 RepID=A0A4U6TZY8_SETVI|nr:uncharacterized protein LOC117864169 [Setaria viridis]TKW07284.1 hypothetical protein SEVIR_7G301150v2 [Setaria viridis]